MTGDTIINGTDIYTTYGAFVSLGGYNSLVEWPASKSVAYNDWQEEDGIEADLSALKLDSHEFEMSFGLQRPIQDILEFYSFLCSSPTMTCSFVSIGLTDKTYRVMGLSSLDHAFAFGEIKVRFADDSPLAGYEYLAPSVSHALPVSAFCIEGTPLSEYGVRTLYGTLQSVFMQGSVKQFLLRNISTIHGSLYDANPKLWDAQSSSWSQSSTKGTPRFNAVEIKLNCALSAPTATEFWRNYNALLWDLTAPDDNKDNMEKCARVLTFEDEIWNTYYYGQTVEDVSLWPDKITVRFTLSLIALGGRSNELIRLLAAEDGSLIITEDNKQIKV